MFSADAITGKTLRSAKSMVEEEIDGFYRSNSILRQVAFVIEENETHPFQAGLHSGKVLLEIDETFKIRFHPIPLRIHNENDSVYATENKLAGSIVDYLAWNRPKFEAYFKALDIPAVYRQEIEK